MKKVISVFAIIVCIVIVAMSFLSCGKQVSVGDTINFGPYSWHVLEKENDKLLIITENIIEEKPFDTGIAFPTWETCSIRTYLNEDFLNKFDENEKKKIQETTLLNKDNPFVYFSEAGNDTTDKVFLLSLDEICKYLGNSAALTNAKKDEYWEISDEYNDARIARYNNQRHWWYLRTPDEEEFDYFVGVDDEGKISGGWDYRHDDGGIRPAMWIKY